ncbi:DMT family transporter [Bradyrhizobium sp. U87765 SZCCT0131]|uniref:DMT family transporter n=1 Tax=unclassified Bradyrhizobium TaxID=2631580 RepID=UPI001BA959BA|nr:MULTISPECIES: DMT family transporter [unclassified Bradyrhizobium]MBR1220579.1 DMT family transporter [Bradyrhizobium sp. U87765 SZCCT0131]MBR1262967.1 DMT family transporter [Bradyrhizobium sp. U87765 SZCCT0134]MBR1307151.1 DMT family transporter [Bradyrhizobium sp. U87765 SZCCT0110]MBR1322962.1 DMT family transporter [Bradyrhizobium sp. U87765 SZCCT0109]MBR1346105.1 DMT family transporter [Bradyrhizobium sp. U87765 SZCCT0048]
MDILFIPISLVAGGLLAVQAGANTQLSKATGSPFAATVIQVLIAGLLLLIIATATGTVTALGGLGNVTWWHATGGIATAIYVASTILLFPRLGAVVTVGLFITGQMLASFGLDTLGVLGVPQQPPRATTLAGLAAVLAGVLAIIFGQTGATASLALSRIGWIGLALIAGAVLPVQGAINGLLRHDLGAPFVVGAISFAVATLSMLLVLAATLVFTDTPKPQFNGLATMPWWGWIGAACGATYVTTVFTAIPVIGTAAAVGLTVAGQQIASLFVDRFGWFRLPQRELSALRYAGVVLLLGGVVLIRGF